MKYRTWLPVDVHTMRPPVTPTLSGAQVHGTGVAHIVHGAGAVLVNELIDQIQADPVEHDGGNDLVDVEVGPKAF